MEIQGFIQLVYMDIQQQLNISRVQNYGFGRTTKTILPDPDPCGIKNTNLDINIQNNFGDIGFHYACSYGHLELVKNLIKNTLDINIQNIYGETGFHLACRNGLIALVELCIKNPSLDINIQNNDGETGFHLACINGYLSIIEFFKGLEV